MSVKFDRIPEMLGSETQSTVISALKAIRSLPIASPLLQRQDILPLVVRHLTTTSEEVQNISLSIAANMCINDGHKDVFVQANGVQCLIEILRNQHDLLTKNHKKEQKLPDGTTSVNHDIICRAWRLASNLAKSDKICEDLFKNGLPFLLFEYLAMTEFLSNETNSMLLRTIEKCLLHENTRDVLDFKKLTKALQLCLKSKDESIVNRTLEHLTLIARYIGHEVEGDLIKQLVALHNQQVAINKEDNSSLPIKALANILTRTTSLDCIEGTGVMEVFRDHIVSFDADNVLSVVVDVVCILCRVGAVRNFLKNNGLITKLILLCRRCRFMTPKRLIITLLLFQYDEDSIQAMVNTPDFVNFLVKYCDLPASVELLQTFARLPQPVPGLVSKENVDMLLKSLITRPLLATIGKCNAYFEDLLLSGKVWALYDAGCSLREVSSKGYARGILQQYLQTKNLFYGRRIAALAVPFLISPEDNKLTIRQLMDQYGGLSEMLLALIEDFRDPSLIAAIVKFAEFIPPLYEYVPKYEHHEAFCQDLIPSSTKKEDESATVTFELNCGKHVVAPKALMCRMSPVIDAMLNGHFSEAGQDIVKLSDCSYKAFAAMVAIIRNQVTVAKLDVDLATQLEMVSLSDRFLIEDLGNALTNALVLTPEQDYSTVYLWSLTAGHSRNVKRLRMISYCTILTKRETLRLALECDESRNYIIDDVSGTFFDYIDSLR